jgi:hypothetical protein
MLIVAKVYVKENTIEYKLENKKSYFERNR